MTIISVIYIRAKVTEKQRDMQFAKYINQDIYSIWRERIKCNVALTTGIDDKELK